VKRDDGKINFSIRRKLFELSKPVDEKTPVFEVVSLFNGDSAVIAVYAVKDGHKEGLDKAVVETLQKRLEQGFSYSEWNGVIEDIRAQTKVQAYPERL
jgi:hypothetical protein